MFKFIGGIETEYEDTEEESTEEKPEEEVEKSVPEEEEKPIEETKTEAVLPIVEAKPEAPEKELSSTVKVKVLVGTLGCPDGRSFEKGEVFEISRDRLYLFERKFVEKDIQLLEE